jgi:hypothetical protein
MIEQFLEITKILQGESVQCFLVHLSEEVENPISACPPELVSMQEVYKERECSRGLTNTLAILGTRVVE